MEETPFQPGDVLQGKYRVESILGSGGMGVVLAAEHVELGERVAIKFLRSAALENHVWVARFMREAKAAAMLRSEHAVRVHDVGTLDTGAPYMVMEYVDGIDVAQWLRDHGPMPLPQASELLLQACEALALAHTRGIVHRDIKPSNLLILEREDGSPLVKVIDFGISKMMADASVQSDGEMTQSQSIIGSPYYMAPEQMRSAKHVDARADIWALGATLHRMLTNSYPFPGGTMMAIFENILDGYNGVRALAPHAPESVDRLLHACLQNDPDARLKNVAEFARALAPHAPPRARHLASRIEAIIQRGPRSSQRSLPATDTEDATLLSVPTSERIERTPELVNTAATQQAWTEAPLSPARSRWLPLGLVLVGAAGLSAFLFLRTPVDSEPATQPTAATPPTAASSSPAAPAATNTPAATSVSASASASASTRATAPVPSPRARPSPTPTPRPAPGPTPKKPDLWDEPF